MAPVIAPSTSTTRACSRSMLVSELSACDADRMPSRSIVPVVTVARRCGTSPGAGRRRARRRVGVWPQGRVGPVQLVDFRGRAPGQVLLAGLGEKVVAGVFEAVGEVEAGRAFGDQGPMPGALALGDLAPRGVEGEGGGAEVAEPPRPARPRAAAAGAGSCPARPRRGRPASGSPRRVRTAGRAARHRRRRGPARPGPARAAGGPRRSGRGPGRPAAAASPPRCAASGRPDRRRWRRRSRG